MKKLGLSLAALLATASFGWAQAAAQAPAEKPAGQEAAETKTAPKTKTHKFDAEVVSIDVDKKAITMKVEGAEKTAPVGALAMYRLKKLKAGDKVIITCKDDAESGEHKEVSFIRMAVEPSASPAPGEKKE